jgi:hypothetical protein
VLHDDNLFPRERERKTRGHGHWMLGMEGVGIEGSWIMGAKIQLGGRNKF